jgi:TRAP-type C4-dicarboxylate transport system, small permease component
MEALIYHYCRALKVISVILLVIMVALVFGNVVLRYAFNFGITVAEELSRWLFVWLTFFASIAALRERQHLGTDFLIARLGRRGKLICLLIAQALMLWICWLLFSGSLRQTLLNWNVTAPSSDLSVAWFYGSGVVFGISAAAVLLEQMIHLLRGDIPSEPMVAEEKL